MKLIILNLQIQTIYFIIIYLKKNKIEPKIRVV